MRAAHGIMARLAVRASGLLLALVLAQGCSLLPQTFGGGSERAPAAAEKPAVPPENATQNTIMNLPPKQQAAVLGSAVGKGCKGKSAFFMGTIDTGSAIWSVRCTSGRTYAVEIVADAAGSTYAMTCAAYKEKTRIECFKKF